MKKELIDYLKAEIALSNLAITACGTDEGVKYVHKLYRERFKSKLQELKSINSNAQAESRSVTDNNDKEKKCFHPRMKMLKDEMNCSSHGCDGCIFYE